MTHCAASNLYRQIRIDSHRMQTYAIARVLLFMYTIHERSTIERHRDKILRALHNME